MSRPVRPWFRLYVETFGDTKMRSIPPEQRWLWAAILALGRESPLPGFLLVGAKPVTENQLQDKAAVSRKHVRDGMAYFVDHGMLVMDESLGAYQIARWNDRQFESDDVTARTSKHRAKERS